LVRPTQHPSWQFVTTRVQSLHKRAIRDHKLGGNGSSCGLITRQNAPLAPVSIARHPDTSASPQKHPSDPPCRPSGCGGLPLASSQQHGQLDLWAGRAGNKTNLDWWRLTDSTQRPQRAPCCVPASAGSFSSRPQRQTGGGPARCRTQPSTIPRLRRQTTLLCLRHRETP